MLKYLLLTSILLVPALDSARADDDLLFRQFEYAQTLIDSTAASSEILASLVLGVERLPAKEVRPALPELTDYAEKNPGNPFYSFALGNAYRMIGNRQMSDSLFALAIRRAGANSGILLALSSLFEKLRLSEHEENAYNTLLDVSLALGYKSRPSLGYYFFRRGLEKLREDERLQAVAEFEKAMQFDPYLLPANLTSIGLNVKLFKGKAASQTIELEKAVTSSFFLQQLLFVNSFRGAIICLVILIVAFILGISFKNLPYIQHQVYEILPERVPHAYRNSFAWVIILLPVIWLWMVFPLIVIPIYLLAVWLVAIPKERVLIFFFFLFLAAIPQLADVESRLLRPLDPNDRVNTLAKAQLRGYEPSLVSRLESLAKKNPSDFETAFSLGLLKHRGGLYEQAMSIFTAASDLRPRSAAVRNNLGNTYFVNDQFDKALDEYELAARLEPDAPAPHYNLSQTFSEKLMFGESSEELSKALRLDFTQVNTFRRVSGRAESAKVMDMTIPSSELWRVIFKNKPRTEESPLMSGLFGLDARMLSYVSSALLLLAIVLGIGLRKTSIGVECAICGAQSCYRCLENDICPRCMKKTEVTDSASMRERLEQKLRARAVRYRKIKALVLSVVSPGAGHVFIGSTWKGVAFSLVFSIVMISTFFKGLLLRMSPFVQTQPGSTYVIVTVGLIAIIYLFCVRSIFRTLSLEEQ